MQNYYELLEVDKKASLEIIKKIFKIKIKQTQPDLFTGEEKIKAEEKTKLLNEAYSILSDETKRAEYDKTLEQNVISLKLLKEENQILKEQIEFLNETIYKKDFILSQLLNEDELSQINNVLAQNNYFSNKEPLNNTENVKNVENIENIETEENSSILKNLFSSLFYTMKDIFLKPLIFIIILFIILCILYIQTK